MKNAMRRKRRREDEGARRAPAAATATATTTVTTTTRSGTGDDEDDGGSASDGAGAIERVERTGAYGSYGSTSGAMSIEDDEWATAQRTWDALAAALPASLREGKVWMPFYYDGDAGKRLKQSGFKKVVHKKQDFFERVRDTVFVKSCACVVDNPPYTGKGMKERILKALKDAGVPFCLLLPLGVLHSAMVREILDAEHVQVIIPRKCYVMKKGGTEVPFRYLCWLCYRMRLERDLYLID